LAKQAPSNKHQITNKQEEPEFEIQNGCWVGRFGSFEFVAWNSLMLVACDLVLYFACDLVF
jgi:hypothetical protein